MDDLVHFLLARYDEEQELAELASPGPWHVNVDDDQVVAVDGITVAEGFALSGRQLRATIDHIAEHDPDRTLQDLNTKRSILELHAIVHRDISWLANDGAEETAELPVCGHCVPKHSAYQRRKDIPEGPCRTVRLLGLPYADDADYQEAWRPQTRGNKRPR